MTEVRWSASKINDANYCRRKFFLKHLLRQNPLNLANYIRGRLIHSLIEHFWERLGNPEEIKRNNQGKITSKKKYSDKDEFIEYAKRQWLYFCNIEERAGREISWGYDNEMWTVYNGYIPEICKPLFPILVEEGRPLESELEFRFTLGERIFSGIIDEIRLRKGNVVVRDYKTENPWMKGMKLKGNPQLTLYCVAVCAKAHADEEFARKLGLEDEKHLFVGNPLFISPKIKPEFFMVDTLRKKPDEVYEMPQLIYTTERIDDDFREVLLFLNDVEDSVKRYLSMERKVISPTEPGRKCDYCDVGIACKKNLEGELQDFSSGSFVDDKGQRYFGFAPPYKVKSRRRLFSPGQRKLGWKAKRKL